jgi:hypothetical protein
MSEKAITPTEEKELDKGGLRSHTHRIELADADEAAAYVAGFHGSISTEDDRRVRRKIDWHLMPPLMVLYFIQFTDSAWRQSL